MARRSSARLRNQSATTPKRVSLAHDAPPPTRTPHTLPAKSSLLSALEEGDEMPGAFPSSASASNSPSAVTATTTSMAYPTLPTNLAHPAARQTPTKGTPIKPTEAEMHPQLHHHTTAKARDEARHLGFSNMAPHTEPPKQKGRIGTLQGTPTKTRNLESDTTSPSSYHFTFRRETSLGLSPEAKQLMFEKREEAARIRNQMVADGDVPQSIDEVLAARKLAKPKGRFSQAHLMEEQKMDSIANHASAWRANPERFKPVVEMKTVGPKSLKRSTSKAKLDEPDIPSRPNSSQGPKSVTNYEGSALPRSTSFKDLAHASPQKLPRSRSIQDLTQASPAKRAKRTETDDVSANRPNSSESEKTVTPNKQSRIGTLSTPTQASLARAASVKSIKAASKLPAPHFTPGKMPLKSALKKPVHVEEHTDATPLLARSPSKVAMFAPASTVTAPVEKPTSMMDSSLARTPAKAGVLKKHEVNEQSATAPEEKQVPFLSRSPVKAAVITTNESDPFQADAPAMPFLSRSPTKLPLAANSTVDETPGKTATNTLTGRFNLLRQSPMKSILRSPQRLYSDDPSKVAAGTHLATPPDKKAAVLNKAVPGVPPASAQARKHVDFSSSTKARDLKVQNTETSSESQTPTPSPTSEPYVDVTAALAPVSETHAHSQQELSHYPQLPLAVPTNERVPSLSPSPQKRRQTAGPQDFTFRAGDHDIVFGQSPNAPASASRNSRPATIRYVSADAVASVASPNNQKKRKFDFENRKVTASMNKIVSPPIGTKKRKFEFENNLARVHSEDVDMTSDKENTPVAEDNDAQRPTKRSKPSAPSPKSKVSSGPMAMTAAATARRTTLGVKPKGARSVSPVKKTAGRPSSTTISQARLAALSQPKKRN